jgi:hypothetical protein
MSRAVRAPGRDHVPADTEQRPNVLYNPQDARSGAGGVHAKFLQGATPKYATNNGERQDYFRNTLARMFVAVSEDEKRNLFFPSLTDPKVTLPAKALTGTPMTYPSTQPPGSNAANAGSRDEGGSTVIFKGYLDFFIQSVQMSMNEKIQVSETLADNYVAYAFGQSPPVWTFQGALINTVQDDQASNMYRLYTQVLRATQLARRQKVLTIAFDSYAVNGVMMNLNMQLSAANELVVPFTFQLLVKRVIDINTTSRWVPTSATTPFAADLFAIGYDGRPALSRSMAGMLAQTPTPQQTVAPTTARQADARVNTPPPGPLTQPEVPSAQAQADEQQEDGWAVASIGAIITPLAPPVGLPIAMAGTGYALAANAFPRRPETANPPGTQATPGTNPQTPVEWVSTETNRRAAGQEL